jgi:uncharacterized membrane protein YkvA (DUF1232 family)
MDAAASMDVGTASMGSRWKEWAGKLKRETYALYLAYRDPRTPWPARLLAAVVVAYALSPIDLIPDPIPVLGYLDDLVLVPLGLALALRMIPPAVMIDSRARAVELEAQGYPANRIAAAMVVALWLLLAGALGWMVWRALAKG